MISPMNLTTEEFLKEYGELQKMKEMQAFQLELQKNEHKFLAEQTERYLQAYSDTNNRLEAINTSLQEQLTAAKAEAEAARKDAKRASIRSWISVGVAVVCAIVEVVLRFL